MNDIEFSENGGCIVCEDHLLKVVDDNLVSAIWSKRSLYRRGDRPASVDVANDGAIFGVVAVCCQYKIACSCLVVY